MKFAMAITLMVMKMAMTMATMMVAMLVLTDHSRTEGQRFSDACPVPPSGAAWAGGVD